MTGWDGAYAELGAMSNFSFLEGASHPGELMLQARALGLAAVGVADRNTLAGIVRELRALREASIALLESLDEEALGRRGVANARVVSVRALGWILAGHFAHHMKVLRERYGV